MQEVKFDQHRRDKDIFRKWNRDMTTCLNFIEIIQSLRAGKGVPEQFCRNIVAPEKRQSDEGSEQRRTRRQQL
jgi:hypothetical protein